MEGASLAGIVAAAGAPQSAGGAAPHLPVDAISGIFLHSIAGGVVLALITYLFRIVVFGRPHNQREATAFGQGLLNLLFLTIGVTGVMVLVRDNVVRAFAVLVAISLVRFRVRVDQKGSNSALIFSIIIGMAHAIQQHTMGWVIIGIYGAILVVAVPTLRAMKLMPQDYPDVPEQIAPPQASPGPIIVSRALPRIKTSNGSDPEARHV